MNLRALERVALCLLFAPALAVAHAPGNSYLSIDLTGERVTGRWDIALRDLEYAVGIDSNRNREITWGEVQAAAPDLDRHVLDHFRLSVDGDSCPVTISERRISRHADGAYLALDLSGDCAPRGSLAVNYSLMFDLDRQHRGLLSVVGVHGVENAVLRPDSRTFTQVTGAAGRGAEFLQFLREGIWHIWIGIDHVLFVLCLVMPAVLQRDATGWLPRARLGPAVVEVVRLVTAFTLAHSLTLALAAYDVIRLPAALVESVIAASIIVVALNNIWPVFRANLMFLAFGFGLVHGLGFASVLQGLAAGAASHLVALLGFNLGVELGQLAIVGAWLPLAFWARRTVAYRQVVVGAGSALIAVIGAFWLLERSLGFAA